MTFTPHSAQHANLGCDTHVHVIGPLATNAMVADRHYTPGPASCLDLKAHLARQNLGRVVIIQPSVYGTDNSCLLAALSELGPMACGIAVLDRNISSLELRQLDAQGIRGIRLNFESSANQSIEQLQEALSFWAARIHGLGWHIQVYAPFAVTAACDTCIANVSVPVVLDHFALWPAPSQTPQAQKRMFELFEAGHIYIKLSASYRQTQLEPSQLTALAHRLLSMRPDRLLWASDWPHTNREPGVHALSVSRYREIGSQQLLHEKAAWLETATQQQCVLIDNPQQLYGFETT